MYTVALMVALTVGGNAPDCHRRCGGGGYGGGCSYGGGGYGGGCSYGGGYGSGGCYASAGYSMDYGKAPDETEEEFEYCKSKQKDMSPETYSNFRNSVWLPMTHEQRNKMMGKKKGKKGGSDEESSSLRAPARILVTLPADATLTIDDGETQSGGTSREFISPPLARNRSYSYTLKAEFVRKGKKVSATKKVAVSAGKETPVSFDDVPQRSLASR